MSGQNGSAKRTNGRANGGSQHSGSNGRKSAVSFGGETKKPTTQADRSPPEQMPPTKLSDAELEAFRRVLLAKRQQLVGAVSTMENEALRKTRSDAAGDLSMMPIHMADIGTDNYEQEFTIGLIANERELLREIDDALDRISRKTFGVCEATHKPITKARLKAKPWARYCLEYKKSQEQSHRR